MISYVSYTLKLNWYENCSKIILIENPKNSVANVASLFLLSK